MKFSLFAATLASCSYAQQAGFFMPMTGEHKLDTVKARIGKVAPDFTATTVMPDGTFSEDFKLSNYLGKWVVFFFYPLDFTFVCPTEIIAFSDAASKFEEINTQVIGCSVDSHFTHLAWTKQARKDGGLGKMNIPLVSDLTKQIAADYGVLLEAGISLRGLFIIDPKGVLRQITMNDLPVGRSVDETMRLVQAFQYTEAHGEVCPANWQPGSRTMIPDPEKKLDYFTAVNDEL
jgi:peroxiredoxin (alkyl hydroperoxide reductase subunit C)